VNRLTNPIKPYAWGSHTHLAALQGRPTPTAEPEAELWMGAHPAAPSVLSGSVPLTEAIASDPVALLGPDVIGRFGPRLPYLMKLLAVQAPLSLQAHPDSGQARDGYAAQAGLGFDDAARSYVDPHHKPELLVAVTEFDALVGFRDPDESAGVLEGLGVPALAGVVEALRTGTVADRLRTAVESLLLWPLADRAELVTAVERAASRSGSNAALAAELSGRYPGDMGVVVALLLNYVRLVPDDAVFLGAGHPHAYLNGFGVEVMAASDNVLRGGLTEKHIDVPELLRVLRYEVVKDPVVRPEPLAPGVMTWPAPVAEFALVKAVVNGVVTLPGDGPRVVVCLHGTAQAGPETLHSGESVFVPASDPPVTVTSDGAVLFQVCPSLSSWAPSS
jgi:mannose-6-phosphate isomerase